MARFQRFNQPRFQRSKRKFNWLGGNSTSNQFMIPLAANTSAISIAFDTRANLQPIAPWTIVRVRGFLLVTTDQQVTSEAQIGAYGICVVNGEAFDAGVGSISTPWSEAFDDRWLYHTYFAAAMRVGGSSVEANINNYSKEIDGKAMRKVNLGDVVVSVMENAGGAGLNFFENFRVGIKLT